MRDAALAVLVLLLSGSGDLRAQAYFFGYAAKVNDAVISTDTLDRNFEEYLRDNDVNIGAIRYPDRVRAMKQETLDLLIEAELLWQAAEREGMLATADEVDALLAEMRAQFPSDETFMRRLIDEGYTRESYREHLLHLASAHKYRESLVAGIVVSDADIHGYYIENPEAFRIPESVRARHILVAVDRAGGDAARKAAREKMENILYRLSMGEDFAALASELSDDSSAPRGGDLGYFTRGEMVESFDDAAFALEPGEVSDIVETVFGLHIIKLEDRRPAQLVSEELVREDLREYLFERKRAQALEQGLAALRAEAVIEIP
jgi:peptidyl-prolyl cis-trans isomerase C